ncbi:uncharacterized protein LOC143026298 [Oratosquilla oratoria]|uniref:uncharacterized protein LOC143026298 n=1 Tax=Oratosquilla oratoria TaxID=337810 RepID=UPI003F765DF8
MEWRGSRSAATVALTTLTLTTLFLLFLGVESDGEGPVISREDEEENGEDDGDTKPLPGNSEDIGLTAHTLGQELGSKRHSFLLRVQYRHRRRRSTRRKIQERMFNELQVMETIKYFLPKFNEDISNMSMYSLQFNTKPIFDGEVKLDVLEDIVTKYSDASDPNRIHVVYVILDVYAALILKIDDHMQKIDKHVEGIWKKNQNIGRAQGSIKLWLTSFRRKLRLRDHHVQTFLNTTFSPDPGHTYFLASYQPGRHLSLIRLLQKHNVASPLLKLNDGLYTLQPVTELEGHIPLFPMSMDNLGVRSNAQEPVHQNETKHAASENKTSYDIESGDDVDGVADNSMGITMRPVMVVEKNARRSQRSLAGGGEEGHEFPITFLRIHTDVIKEDGVLYIVSFTGETGKILGKDTVPQHHIEPHHSHHMELHKPLHHIETNNSLPKVQPSSHLKTPDDILPHHIPPKQILPSNVTEEKTSDHPNPSHRASHHSVKMSNPWVANYTSLTPHQSYQGSSYHISHEAALHLSNQTTQENLLKKSHHAITQLVHHDHINQTTVNITLHELSHNTSHWMDDMVMEFDAEAEISQRQKRLRRPQFQSLEHTRRGISIIRMSDEEYLLVQKTPSDLFFLCLQNPQESKTTRTKGQGLRGDHTFLASFCTSYTGLSSHWYLVPLSSEEEREAHLAEMEPVAD